MLFLNVTQYTPEPRNRNTNKIYTSWVISSSSLSSSSFASLSIASSLSFTFSLSSPSQAPKSVLPKRSHALPRSILTLEDSWMLSMEMISTSWKPFTFIPRSSRKPKDPKIFFANKISDKISEGNIKGAVHLASSDCSFIPPNTEMLEILCSKHPPKASSIVLILLTAAPLHVLRMPSTSKYQISHY